MKKVLVLTLAISLGITSLSACGKSDGGTVQSQGTETAAGQTSTNQSKGNSKEKIEIWYHAADEKSNAIFEELISEFNQSQGDYEAVYTGFASGDFPDKFSMAVATDTMPDVVSLGLSQASGYIVQDALIPVDEYFDNWEESVNILPAAVESVRNMGNGVLYGYPYNYNQDMVWYNTKLFKEKGIEAPLTQADFLALCEEYAAPGQGTYFFSLRSNKPYDNLLSWIFTYADGGGYNGSYFDENGQCIINGEEFVKGLDAYASIYKNNWVSGDSVNNGFNEMVAEFGAETSMYIMHNSSSRPSHEQNLGAGNYAAAKPMTNGNGRYYTSALQPPFFAVTNTKGHDGDYSGAVALIEFLSSADQVTRVTETLDRIPVNMACYEHDWFKSDEFMPLYQQIAGDKNYLQIQNPYWLPSYLSFIYNDMTTDFQALLLGEKTSQQVLDGWAEFLTKEQAEYGK